MRGLTQLEGPSRYTGASTTDGRYSYSFDVPCDTLCANTRHRGYCDLSVVHVRLQGLDSIPTRGDQSLATVVNCKVRFLRGWGSHCPRKWPCLESLGLLPNNLSQQLIDLRFFLAPQSEALLLEPWMLLEWRLWVLLHCSSRQVFLCNAPKST